jgi:hypothetical protein
LYFIVLSQDNHLKLLFPAKNSSLLNHNAGLKCFTPPSANQLMARAMPKPVQAVSRFLSDFKK